jgi:hypothetical protein
MNEIKIIFYPKKSKPITLNYENIKIIIDKTKRLIGREKLEQKDFIYLIIRHRFF